MNRIRTLVVVFGALGFPLALAPVFGQEPKNEQERLIATIRQMGGDVRIDDDRPGKPVVQIHLYKGKTAGIGLTPLAAMPIASLDLLGCNDLHDLTPLAGMRLTDIAFAPGSISSDSLDVLRRCKTLRNIAIGPGGNDRYTTQVFWTKIDAGEFNSQ